MNYSVNTTMKKIIRPIFVLLAVSFFVSCTKKTDSSTKIAGGKHLTLESSDTVKGVFPIITDSTGLCSATAVSHNTAITAAHCSNTNNSTIVNNREKITATQVIMHPQYAPQSSDYSSDVALLIFPDNSFSEYFSIKASQAQIGDDIVLVGYSPAANDDPTKGDKRWGRNTISSLEFNTDALVSIASIDHNSVGVTGGDSGGPLFVNCEIAGVASRSSSPDFATPGQEGLHTDILSQQNASWLRDLVATTSAKICGLDGDTSGCDSVNTENANKDDRSGDHFPCSVSGSSNQGSNDSNSSDNSNNDNQMQNSTGDLPTAGEIKVAARLLNNQVTIAISTDISENAASATICMGTLESCTSDLENGVANNSFVPLSLLKNTSSKRIFSGSVTVNSATKTQMTILVSDSNNSLINHRYIQIGR